MVDGLLLLGGAELAVDTTLVCPLTREGEARAATVSGACLTVAKPRKEARYPELVGDHGRPVCWSWLRGWRPVLVGNSPFLEVLGFRQSAGSAANPARQGAYSVAQEVEFDIGLLGCSRLCSLTFV